MDFGGLGSGEEVLTAICIGPFTYVLGKFWIWAGAFCIKGVLYKDYDRQGFNLRYWANYQNEGMVRRTKKARYGKPCCAPFQACRV